jgi:predicted metalloprotease with PDZ domain
MRLQEVAALKYVLALAFICCVPLRADEPAKNPTAAEQATSLNASIQAASKILADTADLNQLSLVADTHSNLLGVEVADVEGALRSQLGIEEGAGVVVTSVNKDAEGAKSGLQQYDLVFKIGDQKIAGAKQFHDLVNGQQEKSVEFQIIRKGKPATVTVAIPKRLLYEIVDPKQSMKRSLAWWLAAAADDPQHPKASALFRYSTVDDRGEQRYRIGVTLSEADGTLRSQLRLASGEGLVVTEVLDDSAAAKAGIQKNDVLVKLDGKRLTTVEAVNAQIQEIKERKVAVALFRGGSEIEVEVTPRLTTEPSYRTFVTSQLGDMIRWHDAPHFARLYLSSPPEAVTSSTARPTAAEQLAAVKKQLAELHKSVEALEAALQTPPPATPEEKK